MGSVIELLRPNQQDLGRYSNMGNTIIRSGPNQAQNLSAKSRGQLQQELQIKTRVQRSPSIWIKQVYFTPESSFIISLNMMKLVLIYVYFIQIPITLAFENHRRHEESEQVFENINIPAITFFIVCIFIKLKTAFYREGVLINDQSQILIQYFKYNFFFEFLSIASIAIYEFVEIISVKEERPVQYRFIVILFFMKAPEISRIQKSLVNSFDMNRRIKATIKLLILLIKIFLVCNVAACGFFYVSDRTCEQQVCKNCCWIDFQKFDGKPLRQALWIYQYAISLYWASTTMLTIGYGDIHPINQYEVLYTILIQFFSCIVFAFSINQIWDIIQQKNKKKNKIHTRMNIINVYMRDKNVSLQLRSRVNAYLSHFYHTKNLREKQVQEEILSSLTPELRKQLFFQAYGFIFKQHKFFSYFSPEFLEKVSASIQQVGYFSQEVVYQPDQNYNGDFSVYYINRGQMQRSVVLGAFQLNIIKLEHIQSQRTIGLYQFVRQSSCLHTVTALRYSLVYVMAYKPWLQKLIQHDVDYGYFMMVRSRALYEKNYKRLFIQCTICGSQDHQADICLHTEIRSRDFSSISRYLNKQERAYRIRNKLKSSLQITGLKNSGRRYSCIYYDEFERISTSFRPNSLHKKILFQKNYHKEKIDRMIRLKKFQNFCQENDESLDQSQIQQGFLMVDKIYNYSYYFPGSNASNQINKQKKIGTFFGMKDRNQI